jgi:hypothetical protein
MIDNDRWQKPGPGDTHRVTTRHRPTSPTSMANDPTSMSEDTDCLPAQPSWLPTAGRYSVASLAREAAGGGLASGDWCPFGVARTASQSTRDERGTRSRSACRRAG